MLVIAIVVLAVMLLALISKRQPKATTPVANRTQRNRDASDGLIYGETPNGVWEGGPLPPDFTPGGGDFGGAGSSGSWGSGDGGDGGGD